MTGVLIKVWDLSACDREISLLIPLETSIEETVQEIVSGGGLPALVDRESVEHAREVVERILAGSYNYTWDTDLGQRIRRDFSASAVTGSDTTATVDATAASDNTTVLLGNTAEEDVTADTIVSGGTTVLVDTTAEEHTTAAILAAAKRTDDDNITADDIINADFYITAKDDSPDDLITTVKIEAAQYPPEIEKPVLQIPHTETVKISKDVFLMPRKVKKESYPSTDIRETSPKNPMKNTLPYCEVLMEDIMKKKILIPPHDENALFSSDELGYDIIEKHIPSHVERPHKCDICGKRFAQRSSLYCHIRNLHPSAKFPCDINCSEEFDNLQQLKQHQQENHPQFYCFFCSKAFLADHFCALLKCEVCGKEYKEKSKLKSHMRSHTRERPHGCDDCGKTFNQKAALTSHVLSFHSESGVFQCDINCSEQFGSSHLLKLHQKACHPEYFCSFCSTAFLNEHICPRNVEQSYKCDICGTKFSTTECLYMHVRKFHPTADITKKQPKGTIPHCELCGKEFKTKQNLRKHLVVHTGEKPHTCDFCGNKFSQKSNLDFHVMSFHSDLLNSQSCIQNDVKPHALFHSFCCDINCSEKFVSKKLLEEHQKDKHQDYYCSVCSKAYMTDHVCTKTVKKHSCDTCGNNYNSRSTLNRHIKTAHFGNKVGCNINCSEEFRSKKLLRKHQKEHHPEHYCTFCSKAFLTDHICKKNVQRPNACDFCGAKFVQLQSLYMHFRTSHPGAKFPCAINCSEVFESMELLREHQRVNHPDYYCNRCSKAFMTDHSCDLFSCRLCGKGFSVLRSLKQHMETHNDGENQHVCHICGKTFTSVRNLKYHIKRTKHIKLAKLKEPYECNIDCTEVFETKQLLQKHQRISHQEYYCSFCRAAFLTHHTCKFEQCDVCGKRLRGKGIFKKHMLIHTGERPHGCNECGKTFNQKASLDMHMQFKHLDVRYSCDNCDAQFKDRAYLKHHKKFVHAGVFEHVCDICSKKCVSRSVLDCHKRNVHQIGRRFSCTLCEKSFGFPSMLSEHMLSHGEKKTQVCEVCNSSFYTRGQLRQHKSRVHGKSEFVCDVCQKEFRTNNHLIAHKLIHKED